jgi:pantetheine-phosphate adenylyltransferase
MKRIGFYPGSFDPVTLGHTDIIGRAGRLVDRLIVGIGVHDAKRPMFTSEERIALLQAEIKPIASATGCSIAVATFDGLVVDAARDAGAAVIFRGLRNATDFDYEMQMAGMNGAMAPGVETVFLTASPAVQHIAGNLVRQIAGMGGDVSAFVSPDVAAELKRKAAR